MTRALMREARRWREQLAAIHVRIRPMAKAWEFYSQQKAELRRCNPALAEAVDRSIDEDSDKALLLTLDQRIARGRRRGRRLQKIYEASRR